MKEPTDEEYWKEIESIKTPLTFRELKEEIQELVNYEEILRQNGRGNRQELTDYILKFLQARLKCK